MPCAVRTTPGHSRSANGCAGSRNPPASPPSGTCSGERASRFREWPTRPDRRQFESAATRPGKALTPRWHSFSLGEGRATRQRLLSRFQQSATSARKDRHANESLAEVNRADEPPAEG